MSFVTTPIRQQFHNIPRMFEHLYEPVHCFRVRIKVVIILSPFAPHFQNSGSLEYLNMVRYGGTRKISFFCNITNPWEKYKLYAKIKKQI